jgi:hypothetical protein
MIRAAVLVKNAISGCRIFFELVGRTSRTGKQFAAAVRADALEHLIRAIAAERAFEGTDPRIRGIGRQVFVAAFASRAHLKHGSVSLSNDRAGCHAVGKPAKSACISEYGSALS